MVQIRALAQSASGQPEVASPGAPRIRRVHQVLAELLRGHVALQLLHVSHATLDRSVGREVRPEDPGARLLSWRSALALDHDDAALDLTLALFALFALFCLLAMRTTT